MSELCLHRGRARFTIDLHPSTAGDVLAGIREQLQQLLFKYSYDLRGIPLSYNSLSVNSVQAPVGSYFPYFRVLVTAEVLLFRPEVGSRLSGTVGTVGADYLGLLVLGLFNAVVGREHIPGHLRCRPGQGCWVSDTDRRLRLEVGMPVDFVVAEVHEEQDLFAISGSLLEPGTGVSASIARTVEVAARSAADTVAEAPKQAMAAALREPYSAGRPRVVASAIVPIGAAATAPAVAQEQAPVTSTHAASVPKQHAVSAAVEGRNGKGDCPAPLPSADGHHQVSAAGRTKKKRKRQPGTEVPAAPSSTQPEVSGFSQPTAVAAEATANNTETAPDSAPRQHKKRRRDRESAAEGGAASAARSRLDSRLQQPNGPVLETADSAPAVQNPKKRPWKDDSSRRTNPAPEVALAADLEPADSSKAEKKQLKKQKQRLKRAAMAAAQLPNGLHTTASEQPKARDATLPAAQAAAGADRTLPNGVVPHHDALARKKVKAKRKSKAAGNLAEAVI